MLQQGSEAWRLARCGSIGASDAARVVRRVKSGYSADRDNLLAAKVLEKLTGVPVEIPKTFAMNQGTEREPVARMLYSIIKGVEVEEASIVQHPLIQGAHCSPDGFVGARGLVEIKCPLAPNHIAVLLTEQISSDYITQAQWQMACTGRDWCDYASFSSDFPPPMQLWVKRVARDPQLIAALESDIKLFIVEVDRKVAELSRRYGAGEAGQRVSRQG